MSNIKDIAKLANVSPTTVSRVLNNHPYVSETKRQAVLQVIENLNYTPNISAVRLKRGKTNIIAILVPFIDHAYFGPLIKAINKRLTEHGYMTILCETGMDQKKELNYLEMLKQKQVDGILMCTMFNKWELIEPYLQYGPIVLCGEYAEDRKLPTVYVDHYKGAAIALQHLIEKGYRKIAFSYRGKENLVSTSRKQAYIDVLQNNDLQFERDWILHIDQDDVLAGKIIFNMIKNGAETPDAIFVANGDQAAAGLLIEAQKHGWAVPEKLAIIGIDNQPISELLDITTVNQPINEIGKKGAKLLIDILEDKHIKRKEQVYFNLIERKTT